MNVLIVGGGGREHALAWKAAQSSRVDTVFVAPGNAGTAREPRIQNVPIAADAPPELLAFARAQAVELTIVGPEVPLVAGIVDQFRAAGLACVGPTRAAARLEGSKSFCKDFLARHEIPTAAYRVFTDPEPALAYLETLTPPVVIKADGLAAGKGVVLAQDRAQAQDAVRDMLQGNAFGAAGSQVVIEEFLVGEEASFICLVDGENVLPLATSQDHKARDNGDKGPNTGGMGAYSPAPVITPEIHDRVMEQVIRPTVRGMAAEGTPYTGFLYAGLMIDDEGDPKVLEYNCRLGDPETQPILLRLQSDLVTLCQAACAGTLDQVHVQWDDRAALGVVLAAGGYPDSYAKGRVMTLPPESDEPTQKIFHAGTAEEGEHLVTNGGRVLCACALGDSVREAQTRAYDLVGRIHWKGMFYRGDIGYRAVAREH